MDYEELLNKAYKDLPDTSKETERFEVPKPEIEMSGNNTIIKNFDAICKYIDRDPVHFSKYLYKALATAGNIENKRLVLQKKLRFDAINKKIDNYLRDYVYCKECGKPDTKLMKEDRKHYIKCEACGAKKYV